MTEIWVFYVVQNIVLTEPNFWNSARELNTQFELGIIYSLRIWRYCHFLKASLIEISSIFRTLNNQISYVAAIIHLIWPNPWGPEIGATEPYSWRNWCFWTEFSGILIPGIVVATANSCEFLKMSPYLLSVWNYCL